MVDRRVCVPQNAEIEDGRRLYGRTVQPSDVTRGSASRSAAAAFTPDGRYLYVGNYLDQDFSILRVDGKKITDTGKRFKVPGHPASARMSPL
jgi:DNA-binding beta-propeller fold protein YncE